MTSAQKVNRYAKEIFIYVAFLFVLFLTAINISTFLQPKINTKVLGIETTDNSNTDFWKSFLDQHPNYIPGWIEIGRMDKVKRIDPNYF